jgi:hypothetical protein
VRHKQALHFSTVNHAGAVAQSPGVFQIIGPTKRGVEKGVADGIVAAIRQPRAQWIGPKPPRLKRGDAVRILKGSLAHHVGLEVLLSLLEGSQRVTLPESDV